MRARIEFLGTGTAFQSDGRGAAAVLIRPDSAAPFLVDVGPTALLAMTRFGVDCGRIDRVFLTHLHGDHVAGWPFLLLDLCLVQKRRRPLDVHGPPGTRACLEGLSRLCFGEILEPARLGFAVRWDELPVEAAAGLDAGGLRFDVLPMEHHPTSIAFRFDIAGRRVAVTGDTRWCAGLEALARGSDLLVLECTTARPTGYPHVSLAELRERRDALGDCDVVLVHLDDEVAAELAASPLPRVVAAHDGMTLEVG
jgi:ribonuclease BN (tRNA processing enzyme)